MLNRFDLKPIIAGVWSKIQLNVIDRVGIREGCCSRSFHRIFYEMHLKDLCKRVAVNLARTCYFKTGIEGIEACGIRAATRLVQTILLCKRPFVDSGDRDRR